jgi:serine/threonine protein kinase
MISGVHQIDSKNSSSGIEDFLCGYDDKFADFISRATQILPEDRASIYELMAHPWMMS